MEHVTLYQSSNIYNDIKFLKSKNFLILSMDSENSESLYDYFPENKKEIIIFGSEDVGVRTHIRKISDFNFSIPTVKPIQSLNVSNSAAVVFSILDYKKKARHK
jgi:tRNA G18 (ribose-2'-O)-methylase SpoU